MVNLALSCVNALVRESLIRYVDAKSRRLEALDALEELGARGHSL